MNNEMTNETTATATVETSKLPFPSHVKAPAPNAEVHPFSGDIVETSLDIQSMLASAGNVHKLVRPHYTDVATGVYGIERLIARILAEHCQQANCNETGTFPAGVESTEFRTIAIAGAMFANDVIDKVRAIAGEHRYPDAVVKTYLANRMQKEKSQNKVGAIQLTSMEDANRPCPKPRTKYYLLTPVVTTETTPTLPQA
jgi:hypothetical protein